MRTLAEPPEAPRMRKRDFFKRTKSSPAHGPSPQLIAIIVFEECNDGNVQLDLLRAFAEATAHIPCPFRILRPNIDTVEGAENMINIQWLDLEKSRNDEAYILAVLHKGFDQIREAHESKDLPRGWPPTSTIQALLDRACGQAIYASIVLDVIGAHHNPQTSLSDVLQLRPIINSRPSDHVGAVFTYIFSQVPVKKRDIVSRMLGVLYLASDYPDTMPDFDFFRKVFYQHPDPLTDLPFHSLASVLSLPQKDEPVKVLHGSLFQFLLDRRRAGAYFVDIAQAHETLAQWRWRQVCLEAPHFLDRFLEHCVHSYLSVEILEYLHRAQEAVVRGMQDWKWESIDHSLRELGRIFERKDFPYDKYPLDLLSIDDAISGATSNFPKISVFQALREALHQVGRRDVNPPDPIQVPVQSAIASARLANMIRRAIQQHIDHRRILLFVERRRVWLATDISIVAFNGVVFFYDSEPDVEIANLLLEDLDDAGNETAFIQLLRRTPLALKDYSDVVMKFREAARSWLERARGLLDPRRAEILDHLDDDGWQAGGAKERKQV